MPKITPADQSKCDVPWALKEYITLPFDRRNYDVPANWSLDYLREFPDVDSYWQFLQTKVKTEPGSSNAAGTTVPTKDQVLDAFISKPRPFQTAGKTVRFAEDPKLQRLANIPNVPVRKSTRTSTIANSQALQERLEFKRVEAEWKLKLAKERLLIQGPKLRCRRYRFELN